MTATPARDALACYWHVLGTYIDAEHLDRIVRSHGHVAVLAALVESGWRPTADQLRAMGGRPGRRVVAVGTLGTFWQFEGVDGD